MLLRQLIYSNVGYEVTEHLDSQGCPALPGCWLSMVWLRIFRG